MYTRGVTLDPQPVSLETLAQFSSLIIEAAHWLEREGKTLWNPLELTPEAVLERYRLDELFLATLESKSVGTAVLQDTDPLFWPNVLEGEALYAHKLSIARAHAGKGLGRALLDAVRAEAQAWGRQFLRLDTSSKHLPLCAFYENYSFIKVGERQVGPYPVHLYQLEVKSSSNVFDS